MCFAQFCLLLLLVSLFHRLNVKCRGCQARFEICLVLSILHRGLLRFLGAGVVGLAPRVARVLGAGVVGLVPRVARV